MRLQKKGLTGNNNSKIINIRNKNSKKYGFNTTNTISDRQIFLINNKKPITAISSFLNKKDKINKKEKNKEIEKDNSLSISLSSFKDVNHYKSECKKLSEKIKNYHLQNNIKEYPKTTIDFYKIGRCIGRGAFGKVNLSLHILTGKIVAIKSINKSKRNFSNK